MKKQLLVAVLLTLVLLLSRWPGLMPYGFSAVYGFCFCAGVYLPLKLCWGIFLPALFCSDIALNLYYGADPLGLYMLPNYLAYGAIVWIGSRLFSPRSSFIGLLSGGLLGAVLFYLITNTFCFFENPLYAKTLQGWIQALTTGVPGFPPTWTFFRHRLTNAGLCTALFAAAMKAAEKFAPVADEAEEEQSEEEDSEEKEPEKASANSGKASSAKSI